MPKTILASLTGLGSDHTVLESAVALARIEGGHVCGLHTRIDILETAALIETASPRQNFSPQDLLQEISSQEDTRSRHARRAFEEACTRHALGVRDTPVKDAPSLSAEWKENRSFLNETLHEARYHDVTVMRRDEELSSERIVSVLMQSGRPLLLAPLRPTQVIGRRVAIAWKPVAEAARTVTAASFILSRAEEVVILYVAEDENPEHSRASAEHLAAQLAWQGIRAEVRLAGSRGVTTSQALLDAACEGDADLLVAGAYGHSRMREFIFGGVTRDLLQASALPLFMLR